MNHLDRKDPPPVRRRAALALLGLLCLAGAGGVAHGTDKTDRLLGNYNLARGFLQKARFPRRANLAGVQLPNENCDGATFDDCDLSNANFRGARWTGVKASRANLSGANFSKADLCGAMLIQANLRRANLSEATLCKDAWSASTMFGTTDFTGANLTGVIARFHKGLDHLKAPGVRMDKGEFPNAWLLQSRFPGASTVGADFTNSVMHECDWRGANLTKARCQKAVMKNSSFVNAKLTNADLRDADLSGCDLAGASVKGAKFNGGTRWPAGFRAINAGAVLSR